MFTEQAPERLQAIAELYDPLVFCPSRRVGDFFCRVRKQAAADGVPYFAAGVESCYGAGIAADSDRHPFRQSRLQLMHARPHFPGDWVSHIGYDSATAALYRDRRNVLLAALHARDVEVTREYDGINVWLPLCREPAALLSLMEARGWLIRAGTGFYLSELQHAIRLTPGSLSDKQSEALAQDLADALHASGNAVSLS